MTHGDERLVPGAPEARPPHGGEGDEKAQKLPLSILALPLAMIVVMLAAIAISFVR